ncbi:PQQ-binding-like beta-propeller repeat protein, partial [Candidatus Bathyarchaeota archaeon]|nr:PQQ-binding-like beta-propeller repeat protein [Candidatus Bathyarchaeota archaeon]
NNDNPVNPENPVQRVIEVDPAGNIVWEITGLAQPHEVQELPNGNLLIADTYFDRVIEVDYDTKDILWEWNPKYIDWGLINTNWSDPDHFYNSPFNYDWSHINDVNFKQYPMWNACLISIRNFDLVVEVNHTAERANENQNANNWSNIVWYYGDYGNYSMIKHQHNPEYLSSGNVMIADSNNARVIEVDYATKEIVWEFTDDGDVGWCRDADEMANGNILITDDDRVIEVNYTTKEVIWSFEQDLVLPYEADELPDGNILIGTGGSGFVFEVDKSTGKISWQYGFSFIKTEFYMNCLMILVFNSLQLTMVLAGFQFQSRRLFGAILYGVLIAFVLFLLIFYADVLYFFNSISILDDSIYV